MQFAALTTVSRHGLFALPGARRVEMNDDCSLAAAGCRRGSRTGRGPWCQRSRRAGPGRSSVRAASSRLNWSETGERKSSATIVRAKFAGLRPAGCAVGMAAKAPTRRQVDGRDKRERAGDVQVDVDEVAVVRAGVAAANYQLVAARQPAEACRHSSVRGFQLKPMRGCQLLVSALGTGVKRKRSSLPFAATIRSLTGTRSSKLLPGNS